MTMDGSLLIALQQNKIDVMVIFTTDGQLSQVNAVVLEDFNKSCNEVCRKGKVSFL